MKLVRILILTTCAASLGCVQSWGIFWETTLTLDRSEINLLFGSTDQLKVTTLNAGSDFVWTSSDPTKVNVSSTGTVTPRATGTVLINVRSADNRRFGQAFVTVPRSQVLTIRGGGSNTLYFYDPLSQAFTLLSATLTANAGAGANAFPITAGVHARKILIVHGNSTASTTIFDPINFVTISGPTLSGNLGTGGHSFSTPQDKQIIVHAGTSSLTSAYDMSTNSISAGSPLTANASVGAGSFTVASGPQAGKTMTLHGGGTNTISMFNPTTASYSTDALTLPANAAAGSHNITVRSGSAGSKVLIALQSGSTAIYNPASHSFAAGPITTNNTNNGGFSFEIQEGTNAGKVMTIHGNSQNFSAIFETDLSAVANGPDLPVNHGNGSHGFAIFVGGNKGRQLIFNNVSGATNLYDPVTNTYLPGPAITAAVGAGAHSIEMP